MAEWPVVVTNRCADRCAGAFGSAERELARLWLQRQIPLGRITNQLPRALGSRRSPSGRFLVVDQVLALPLKADDEGLHQWIATDCILFPEYRKPPDLDPFALSGRQLLQQVDFTEHVIERFQERYSAHPDPSVARKQLWDRLEPTVRAVRRPPAWCRTKPSDFFLVAADEFCLPAKWQGGGGKAFTVTTFIHRASDLGVAERRTPLSRFARWARKLFRMANR
jgi:hypothetical protein